MPARYDLAYTEKEYKINKPMHENQSRKKSQNFKKEMIEKGSEQAFLATNKS